MHFLGNNNGLARKPWRLTLALLLLASAIAGFACGGGPEAPPGAIHVLTAKGNVGPIMSRYIDRGIDHAEKKTGNAIVIRLDTPGGLSTSMDDIVKRIFSAKVPVIVYIWPPGGRAASAGTFITMASHVAAMAPATSIGAATPVGGGGEDLDKTLADKATNDAAARIRDIAIARGRNADWAEAAVRQAASAGATEAFGLNVVEFVAPDLQALLASVDGRQISLDGGRSAVLKTATAPIVQNDRTLVEDFLDIIGDPNIALLLISLGTIALFFEIINPGAIFPGVFGIISLIFGFFSLSVIPFNWAGLALILVAIILFFLEIFVTSGGVLGAGGIVSLILGGLLLTVDNPSFAGPGIEVNRWLIYGLSIGMGVFILYIVANILRIRRMPVAVGMETMVGQEAVVRSSLDPSGFVFLKGEYWSAESEDSTIQPGEKVIVTEVQGLHLRVKKQQTEGGSQK